MIWYYLLSDLLIFVPFLHLHLLLPPGLGPVPKERLKHHEKLLGEDGQDGDNTGDQDYK